MVKVTFLKDGQFCPNAGNSNQVVAYKKGETKEFSETTCAFLVKVGIAQYYDEAKAKEANSHIDNSEGKSGNKANNQHKHKK